MAERRVWTVADVTAAVRRTLAACPDLADMLVEGEISNLSLPASGHAYFSLQDRTGTLRCVCFRREMLRLGFVPENGMVVVAHGRLEVWDQGSQYQLRIDRLTPSGVGALALAVEQRRRRLAREGLFDSRRKRPLPRLPRRVAVVTSMTGAAVRDVRTVLRRRAPGVDVVLVAATVQGEGAAETVVLGLERAHALRHIDVILVVRGGGSFEDLAPFQAESVVRAIARSRIPVVTGIGHETDVTLADHAADHRAATPSAAAELAVPAVADLMLEVTARRQTLIRSVRLAVERRRSTISHRRLTLARLSPEFMVGSRRQDIDARAGRLRAALVAEINLKERQLSRAREGLRMRSPATLIPAQRDAIGRRSQALEAAVRSHLRVRHSGLDGRSGRLRALSPRRILERGYSITFDQRSGAIITDPAVLQPGQYLRTEMAAGAVHSLVVSAPDPGERMYDDATGRAPDHEDHA